MTIWYEPEHLYQNDFFGFNQLEKLEAAKAAWVVCLSLYWALLGSSWSFLALVGLTLPYFSLTWPYLALLRLCLLTNWLTTIHYDFALLLSPSKNKSHNIKNPLSTYFWHHYLHFAKIDINWRNILQLRPNFSYTILCIICATNNKSCVRRNE